MVESMLEALRLVLSPEVIPFLLIGIVAGLAVGILPGLGGPSAISVLLPLTLFMDPLPALAMILALMASTHGIDSVPAIMFGMPGEASAQATVMDGHPMARKGLAGQALGAAYAASMFGGLIGAAVLTAIIPIGKPLVSAMGSPQLLMLALLGIVMTATLTGGAPAKGLLAGLMGLLVAMIGVDGATGTPRWWFGSLYLFDGVPLVIVGLGLFAIPEIADLMIRGTQIADKGYLVKGGVLSGMRQTVRNWFLVLRTGALGAALGIIPGLGGAVIQWIAYGHARSTEKGARDTFGKGDIRGVIGVDAATNAKDAGGLVPTVMFGVPGSSSMALLLLVFLVQGIQPGPDMVGENLDMTLAMVWILVLANFISAAICLTFIGQVAKLALVPANIIGPVVVATISFAAVNASRSIWDLAALFVFGLLGWVMKRLRWPRPPLLIGFVLGPLIERYLWISQNRYGFGWLLHPEVMVIMAIAVAVVVFELRNIRAEKRHRDKKRMEATHGDPVGR